MPVLWQYDIFFSDFSYTPGLTSIVFNQSSKYIKIWYLSHKIRESSVGKKGASSGFNSRAKPVVLLTFMACIGKLTGNWQNVAAPVELVGKLDN